MPLSVKDGMGAWITDFQKSDAPQFKGKSDKERREMAMAAYMSAKKGQKDEGYVSAAQRKAVWANRADDGKGHPDKKNEATDKPPFTPDPPEAEKKNSDGTKTSPMSRAKQLAKMARDRNMKKESVELEEMYASTTEPHKDGHRSKVVKTQPNGKTTMSYLGQHVYKSKEHARNAADHIANGMRKGRASDSYIQDFARRHHKEHGMKESVEHLDEAHAYAKAAKALHDYGTKNGGIDKKDFHTAAKHLDNVGKSNLMQKGVHLGKFNDHIKGLDTDVRDRIHMTLKQHGVMESVEENVGAPQTAAHRRAQSGSRYSDIMKKRQADNEKARQALKDPDHNPSWANSKSKMESVELDEAQKLFMFKTKAEADKKAKEVKGKVVPLTKQNFAVVVEDVEEARKYYGTDDFGNSLRPGSDEPNTSPRRPASQPHAVHVNGKKWKSFPSAAMANKAVQTIKDRHGKNATVHKESVEEAKDFDQKFKDHLKFATSKSPAVQNYLAKRKADRDAMNKKNDPNAAKKGYALTAVPPERKYQKLQKAKKAGKA